MPAATARQAAPVARREPVQAAGVSLPPPGLPSLTSSWTAVLARDAICARAGLHVLLWAGAVLHSMHPEFFCIRHSSHSCIPKCQRYILHSHSMHSALLSSAPHAFSFLHSEFQPQLPSRRSKLHSALHVSHSAFHQSCIPHPSSLTAVPGCAGTLHRYRA